MIIFINKNGVEKPLHLRRGGAGKTARNLKIDKSSFMI